MKIFKGTTFVLLALLLALSTNGLAQDKEQAEEQAVEEAAEQVEEQVREDAEDAMESLQPMLGTEVDEEGIEETVEDAAEEVMEQADDEQALVDEEKAAAGIKAEMKKDQTGTNPLNFTYDVRLYNEYMWLNTLGDGWQNVTTFEYRAPFAGGKWQFRGKIRGVGLQADFNNDGFDDVDESGFGDMDLRFMTIPYLKKFGVATGVEFFLDTASEDALGTGANIVGPFVFLGFFNPFGKGSLLVPGYQHKISVDEDTGRDKVHQGLIDIFMVKTFQANKYWAYVDPQILLDYENNIQFMLIEIQAGMMTGPKGQSAWIMPSIGVGKDRPYDFSLEVGYKIVWR